MRRDPFSWSVRSSTMMRSDRASAWRILADVRSWPTWLKTVTSVVPLDGKELNVGARFRVTQPRLGETVWRVTELAPGASFKWMRSNPGLKITGSHALEEEFAGQCSASISLDMTGVLTPLAVACSGRIAREYVNMEAAALAARIERSRFS